MMLYDNDAKDVLGDLEDEFGDSLEEENTKVNGALAVFGGT